MIWLKYYSLGINNNHSNTGIKIHILLKKFLADCKINVYCKLSVFSVEYHNVYCKPSVFSVEYHNVYCKPSVFYFLPQNYFLMELQRYLRRGTPSSPSAAKSSRPSLSATTPLLGRSLSQTTFAATPETEFFKFVQEFVLQVLK